MRQWEPATGCKGGYSGGVLAGAVALRFALLVAPLACLAASSEYALAAAEEEWQLGLQAGGATIWAGEGQRSGLLLGVDAQRGWNDSWALRAGFDAAWFAGDASTPSNFAGANLSAGGTYTFDVLRWVPFTELNVVALGTAGGGTNPRLDLGPQLAVGADYLLDRRYSIGVLAKYAYLAINAAGSGGHTGTPQLATLSLRISYRLF